MTPRSVFIIIHFSHFYAAKYSSVFSAYTFLRCFLRFQYKDFFRSGGKAPFSQEQAYSHAAPCQYIVAVLPAPQYIGPALCILIQRYTFLMHTRKKSINASLNLLKRLYRKPAASRHTDSYAEYTTFPPRIVMSTFVFSISR